MYHKWHIHVWSWQVPFIYSIYANCKLHLCAMSAYHHWYFLHDLGFYKLHFTLKYLSINTFLILFWEYGHWDLPISVCFESIDTIWDLSFQYSWKEGRSMSRSDTSWLASSLLAIHFGSTTMWLKAYGNENEHHPIHIKWRGMGGGMNAPLFK